jgi:hypothetical protein
MIYTLIINSILVACAILIHYEALNFLSILIPKLKFKHRLRVLFGLFGAFIAHVLLSAIILKYVLVISAL